MLFIGPGLASQCSHTSDSTVATFPAATILARRRFAKRAITSSNNSGINQLETSESSIPAQFNCNVQQKCNGSLRHLLNVSQPGKWSVPQYD